VSYRICECSSEIEQDNKAETVDALVVRAVAPSFPKVLPRAFSFYISNDSSHSTRRTFRPWLRAASIYSILCGAVVEEDLQPEETVSPPNRTHAEGVYS